MSSSTGATRHAGFLLVLLIAALCLPTARSEPADPGDVDVSVEIAGEVVKITASFYADVAPREAWEVLIDYDHAVDFVSDLDHSSIDAREGNAIIVTQKGKAKFGPFSFPVESVRRIQLTPFEKTESHLIRGTMSKLDVTTLLKAEGRGTRITVQTESIPNFWLPPILGRLFIAHAAREKFNELRKEMNRRKKAAPDK